MAVCFAPFAWAAAIYSAALRIDFSPAAISVLAHDSSSAIEAGATSGGGAAHASVAGLVRSLWITVIGAVGPMMESQPHNPRLFRLWKSHEFGDGGVAAHAAALAGSRERFCRERRRLFGQDLLADSFKVVARPITAADSAACGVILLPQPWRQIAPFKA